MHSMIDAILLCGGAGLRLRSVTGGVPKSMVNVGGRPFLELLLRQLRRHGFRRVILAVGYQQDVIHSYFGERVFDLSIEYSSESSPLGTGGALRNASRLVESDSALVMNGDSYTPADLCCFATDYREAKADVSLVVVRADGRADCGLVSIDQNRNVLGFREKQFSPNPRYVNAGIYMVARRILSEITPRIRLSLEEELFPQWLAGGKSVRAFVFSGRCMDIGTPERLLIAQDVLGNAEVEASAPERNCQS
jgi:NDP-sugar pyrophosphorylase family protein